MPTYEYECTNCNKIFEVFQRITEEPLKSCPKCKNKISRLIGGGSGIIFKGSGFYATDYRKPEKNSQKPATCPASSQNCTSCPNSK
ncbi:MAG: FmdB family zinc ribbon protein [Candidatus Omnitrophota bacterium]